MENKYTKKELLIALKESLKLQAHYAKLLNEYDNGERVVFENVGNWINRLRDLGMLNRLNK